jgi:hypothetical protein
VFEPICEGVNAGGHAPVRLLLPPVEGVLDTEVTGVEGGGDAELSSSGVCEFRRALSDGSLFGLLGSYFLGLPRERCRRFKNSASSTIQNEPKSSS